MILLERTVKRKPFLFKKNMAVCLTVLWSDETKVEMFGDIALCPNFPKQKLSPSVKQTPHTE